MVDLNIKPGEDNIVLTYDLYSSDGRSEMVSWAANDRYVVIQMNYRNRQVGRDRRCLTYDYYPGNRRRNRK